MNVFGAREYSMRIWLDPDKMYARELTTDDIVAAIQGKMSRSRLGVWARTAPPNGTSTDDQYRGSTNPDQFGQIIVKRGDSVEIVCQRT